MFVQRRYGLWMTLKWSATNFIYPFLWAGLVTAVHIKFQLEWMELPWLPMSLIGVSVSFFLGFRNNASYERVWEARKIYGAIVNASRSWAFSARDLVQGDGVEDDRRQLVHRHVAWMDALRHQLRQIKTWEHSDDRYGKWRKKNNAPEYHEDVASELRKYLSEGETTEVLAQLNPAARLLANQSRHLSQLVERGHLDAYRQVMLQEILVELMAQQGKAERIKNFPFPRQYATVNTYFVWLLVLLLPFGLFPPFLALAETADQPVLMLLLVPFSALVSWVYLTTDQIGSWSENPFEGLANDVPISAMSRGIERDVLQMIDTTSLPEPRKPMGGQVLM